jgi:hypothetical protein
MLDPMATAEQLTKQFVTTLGSALRSVVLFGSVARGEAIPGMSDVNVLVLLDEIGAQQLAVAAPLLQQWVRSGNTPPHIFSWEEWGGMGDTFALEIADMQDARKVLSGGDPVPAASPKYHEVRLHAEHEIRDTILHLRLRMLLAANNPRELGNLLVSGTPSFAAYMRTALRLSGRKAPLKTVDVIESAAQLIGADPAPMLLCYEAKCAQTPPQVPITAPLVVEYQEFTRHLMMFIDQIPPEGTVAGSPS